MLIISALKTLLLTKINTTTMQIQKGIQKSKSNKSTCIYANT